MALDSTAAAAAVASIAFVALIRHLLVNRKERGTQLPPGPPGLPLLENLFDMPTSNHWLVFAEWAKKYGDIMSIRVLGHTSVVLNSARDVREILIKRGIQCGSRMRYVMAAHAGWEHDVHVVSPAEFRIMKRYASKNLSPTALERFGHVMQDEVSAFLRRILQQAQKGHIDPERLLKRMVGSTTLRIAYGYTVSGTQDSDGDEDEFVKMSEQAIGMLFVVTAPGWLVDMFPWMRHLPSWILGPTYARTLARSRELMHAIRTRPVEWTQKQLAAGTAAPSLTADLLASSVSSEQHEEDTDTGLLFGLLADFYTGAVDTTLSTSLTLLLTLALHPEIQAKAQHEIDALLHDSGDGGQLPILSDRTRLPYVCALVKEVYRFRGVVNMGFPHRATQDIEYKGYIIPKDALISPNIWSIFHDPVKYPDPYTFNPERFLNAKSESGVALGVEGDDSDETAEIINEDPTRYVFGFEPRKCPGRHIADSIIFLLAARLLATCDVSNAIDATDGRPIEPRSVEYTGSFVSRPKTYRCKITPRRGAETLLAEHNG